MNVGMAPHGETRQGAATVILRVLLAFQILTYPMVILPCVVCCAVDEVVAAQTGFSCCEPVVEVDPCCCPEEPTRPQEMTCECCPIESDETPRLPLPPGGSSRGDVTWVQQYASSQPLIVPVILKVSPDTESPPDALADGGTLHQARLCVWLN